MNQRLEIRLECLRLACTGQPGGSLFNADQVIERADKYHEWVTKQEPTDQPTRTSRKAPAHARKSGR